MKKIGMLGKNGFIGRTVLKELEQRFPIVDGPCDILVNCAGFSIMYEARKNPAKMQAVEDYTFERISNVQFDYLIHLSTIYTVANPTDPYGRIKIAMENRVLEKYPKAAVLRLGSILGEGLKKNVVFDLLHDKSLWVTSDSIYNYISTEEVSKIIMKLIEVPIEGIINIGASESISVKETAELMGKNPIYGSIKDYVVIDTSLLQTFHSIKTSKAYIQEFVRKYNGT